MQEVLELLALATISEVVWLWDCLTYGHSCRKGCSLQDSVGLLWMMLLRQVCECCPAAYATSAKLVGCMSIPMQFL